MVHGLYIVPTVDYSIGSTPLDGDIDKVYLGGRRFAHGCRIHGEDAKHIAIMGENGR